MSPAARRLAGGGFQPLYDIPLMHSDRSLVPLPLPSTAPKRSKVSA